MVTPINQPSAEAVGQQLQPGDHSYPSQYLLKGSILVRSEQFQIARKQGGRRELYRSPEGIIATSFNEAAFKDASISFNDSTGFQWICIGEYNGVKCMTDDEMNHFLEFMVRAITQAVSLELYVAVAPNQQPSSGYCCGAGVIVDQRYSGNNPNTQSIGRWTPNVNWK